MIQTLGQTMGLDRSIIIILDKLRKQRNVADYSGDVVPESATTECIEQAKSLIQELEQWLHHNKPELIND